MKHKVKVPPSAAEQEIEIELDLATLGLITKQELGEKYSPKDVFEAELGRRVASITKGRYTLEDLESNAELKQKVMDKLGVKLTPDGKPQLTADQVASLQEDWRKRELTPVVGEKEKAVSRVQKLLDRILEGEILQAGVEAHLFDHLLKPVSQGGPVPIVSMLRPAFGFSDEHEAHFVKKGEGFEFSSDPKATGRPYMTPREFVLDWATKKENAPFVNTAKPGAPKLGQPGIEGGARMSAAGIGGTCGGKRQTAAGVN